MLGFGVKSPMRIAATHNIKHMEHGREVCDRKACTIISILPCVPFDKAVAIDSATGELFSDTLSKFTATRRLAGRTKDLPDEAVRKFL